MIVGDFRLRRGAHAMLGEVIAHANVAYWHVTDLPKYLGNVRYWEDRK